MSNKIVDNKVKEIVKQKKKRLNAKWCEFICSKIILGLSIETIANKYSTNLPKAQTIRNKINKDAEFGKMVRSAREIYYDSLVEEFDDLSKSSCPEDVSDPLEVRLWMDDRKTRLAALRTIINEFAPILSSGKYADAKAKTTQDTNQKQIVLVIGNSERTIGIGQGKVIDE